MRTVPGMVPSERKPEVHDFDADRLELRYRNKCILANIKVQLKQITDYETVIY